jgi:hypothetical protein
MGRRQTFVRRITRSEYSQPRHGDTDPWGLADPAGLITVPRYTVRCRVGNTFHVLTQHPSFAKLLREEGPAPMIRGRTPEPQCHSAQWPAGIAGLHFFVFGDLNQTLDWIKAELKGSQSMLVRCASHRHNSLAPSSNKVRDLRWPAPRTACGARPLSSSSPRRLRPRQF